jgi:SnoaL-like domain
LYQLGFNSVCAGLYPGWRQHSGPFMMMDMSADRSAAAATTAAFRQAVESQQMDTAIELLHPDAVFHSPIVYREYIGRDVIAPVLRTVAEVFEEFRYTAEYASGDGHVLMFRTRVGNRDLEGVDILRCAPDGRIRELTVMVRPFSAAAELRARMAALLCG